MLKVLGFKRALIASMILLMMGSLLLSNWLSYREIRQATINDVNQTSKRIVESEAKKIQTWFHSKAAIVNGLAETYQQGVYQGDFATIARVANSVGEGSGVYIGFDDGNAYSSAVGDAWDNGKAVRGQYEVLQRPWYSQGKAAQVTDVTEVYPDATTGLDVVSIIKAMGDGVALIDIELSILKKTVAEIDYPGAVTVITDTDGKVMASNSSVVGKGSYFRDFGMGQVERNMLAEKITMQNYTLGGDDKIAFTQRIELVNGKNWYLFIGVNKSIAYASLTPVLTKAVISSLLMLAVGIILLLIVLNVLYRPITQLTAMIQDLSKGNGDLTRRLDIDTKDDLGKMATGINAFIAQLQQLMIEVQHSSNSIDNSIDRLKSEADANKQILNAHTQETEQIVAAVEEMSATANDVARNGSETAAFTQTTNEQALTSKGVVGHATSTVAQLVQEVEATSENIAEIDRDTVEITNVLRVIGEIAEQTNLLALNAAIEAARAGEQGRGFAVVADEVRALAARTQQSTAEIEDTINKLRNASNSAISAMHATKVTCEQTAEATDQVAMDLDGIVGSVTQINDLNCQIATAAEEQSSVSDEITRNMAAISEMANELSMNGEVNIKQTESLAGSNSELKAIVAKFKLK
ncbi:methyl-accepting chemotaxis protein [Shewanella sp. 202IG2-18]|uniref:methyl-accepting chemotaxis protein n=1 Tax=Parashewanella hymeniacidonis TaxID=2807618 RepID=UPI00195F9C1E|nr:methyl-accepting chemotaxis protein [Parashewanella hymeniacidonis]